MLQRIKDLFSPKSKGLAASENAQAEVAPTERGSRLSRIMEQQARAHEPAPPVASEPRTALSSRAREEIVQAKETALKALRKLEAKINDIQRPDQYMRNVEMAIESVGATPEVINYVCATVQAALTEFHREHGGGLSMIGREKAADQRSAEEKKLTLVPDSFRRNPQHVGNVGQIASNMNLWRDAYINKLAARAQGQAQQAAA